MSINIFGKKSLSLRILETLVFIFLWIIFMFKFDLKSGYHHIDILQKHQAFLGFSWVVNGVRKFFVLTVLPFGLSSAPYIFTKVGRVLVRYWRSYAVRITVYLDDGLGFARDFASAFWFPAQ